MDRARIILLAAGAAGLVAIGSWRVAAQAPAGAAPNASDPKTFLNTYCIGCHNARLRTSGLTLDGIDLAKAGEHAEVLERVLVKLRAGSMPPPNAPRPGEAIYKDVIASLSASLDQAWAANPRPGRIGAVHRLNRAEYTNAIRDLFALDLDLHASLPGDGTADGSFDNFADVLSISTAHLERYMAVARQVTRMAVGLPPAKPALDEFKIPLHILQDDRMSEKLPFGSRGGQAVDYNFPVDGEYTIRVRLQRQYQDYLKGMGWPQQLEIRLDGKLLKRFTVGGSAQGRPAAASYAGDGEPGFRGSDEWEAYMQVLGDQGLEVRVPVTAGPHTVGASFVRQLWEPEGLPQERQLGRVISNDQVYMDNANVGSVSIGGPFAQETVKRDTPSRSKIFVCQPSGQAEEKACAGRIIAHVARLAYRRPATQADVETLLPFFEQGRETGGSFDHGVQFALERMLVDPDFLLRVYRDPKGVTGAYRLSDLDVASRLSFFLWSSIPDDRLLTLAERSELTKPETLRAEVKRMLADPRASEALVKNFASQWLNLRLVEDVVVDPTKYPLYDQSLLEAFITETELFVASTIAEDKGVRSLLDADYTFVNERLARHYKIPGVYGTRFRRVSLGNANERGGILAHGSILVTTSYPDRTSPVLRGKWLLNNMLGLPVPPPPPGVNTALEARPGAVIPSIRQRLEQHRQEPTCNSCHAAIDPLGFALENFDVVGGYRTADENGNATDASGTTLGGVKIDGLAGLRAYLLKDPEAFPRTVTEKLMAFALGRRLEYYDQPAVRKIVRDAAGGGYKWSAIIEGIAASPGFLRREVGN